MAHSNFDPCAEPAHALSLEEALNRIQAAVAPLEERERLPLNRTRGRVLAEPVDAPFDLPPFANSAMDGYALRSDDLAVLSARQNAAATGTEERDAPPPLRVVGASFAGRPYAGKLGPGECARVFTGAALPEGADTVAMQEDVEREGELIRLARLPVPRANVRPAGDEAKAGERLLPAGKILGPVDLGVLASAGLTEISVRRKARVAFFSTGDELRPLGEPLDYGQIYDSNRPMLEGLLAHPAVEAVDLGRVPDDPRILRQILQDVGRDADAIVSSGGVSVGEADFVADVLRELGHVEFWKVAIKPGKPFAFGRIGKAWFFGLPGNPVAVWVTFRQLVRPALAKLAGATLPAPVRLAATCRAKLKKAPGRVEFQRGAFAPDADGGIEVTPCQGQGSHQLLGASQANCFIVLPAECAGTAPGDRVAIEPFAGEHWLAE